MAHELKSKKKYLEKGLAKLQKAAEADEEDRLSEALSLYIKGTGHLYNSLQYDDHTEAEKKSLHANYLQYLARVDRLEEIIDDQKRKKKEEKKTKKKKPLFKFQQGRSYDDDDCSPATSVSSPSSPQVVRHQKPPLSPTKSLPIDSQSILHKSSKPVQAVPPTTVASVRPLPPIPSAVEERTANYPPYKASTLNRHKPPPVPNSPRPSFSGSATLGRTPSNLPPPPPPTMNQLKNSTSPSVSLPGKNAYSIVKPRAARQEELADSSSYYLQAVDQKKQPVQVHRGPEVHSSGTLLRIRDKYNMGSTQQQSSPNKKEIKKKAITSLDSDTLLTNAQTIIALATKEDLKGNYDGALQQYEDAVKLFYFILREYTTVSPESRESIRSHCVLYQDRIDTLKAMLSKVSPCQQNTNRSGDEVKIEEEYQQIITTDKPNIKFTDVAGHDHARDLLTNTILSPIKFPQVYVGNNGKIPRNVLLYGPPGCGKTFLAKATACEASTALYFYVKAAELVSRYLSDAVRLIQVLFEKARQYRPSVLVIDDLEYLQYCEDNSDVCRIQKQELARQIQTYDNNGVFIIGVSNAPWSLDTRIKNCFDRTVMLALPDLPARVKILNMHLKEISHSLNEREMSHLANNTERFSGADLSTLIHDALMQPVFRLQHATHFKKVWSESHADGAYVPCRPDEVDAVAITLADMKTKDLHDPCLSYDDVKIALESFRCSVTAADLLKFEEYRNNRR